LNVIPAKPAVAGASRNPGMQKKTGFPFSRE
jgi:hypothetical protein